MLRPILPASSPRSVLGGLFLAIALGGCLWPRLSEGAVRVVAADGSGDHLTVQSGIDAAASGDTLRIAPGTYLEHLRLENKDLLLEGIGGPEVTILDGQNSGRILTILSAPNPVILRGLTFQHGVMGGVESFDQGGGVAAFLSTLHVEDCIFRQNVASSRGAGLVVGSFIPAEEYALAAAPAGVPGLTVLRCSFVDNLCGGAGGGIHCDQVPSLIQDATFIGNHAGGPGGGVDFLDADHRIERCRFEANSGFLGAGVAMVGQGVVSVTDTEFQSNHSNNFGGGVWAVNASGVVLERVRFLGNRADRGGALFLAQTSLLAGRVLFRSNSAVERGGAVHLEQVPSARLDRSTWFENSSPTGSSVFILGGNLNITASIVGDESPSATGCFGGATVTSSCTVGGQVTGTCLTFVARVSLDPCEGSPELLCTVPSPGTCGPVGYADLPCPVPACDTPTQPTTWGSIKARYPP